MPPKEPIWCFVTGGETVFSVNRIESWSVYDLKEAMKAKKPQDLGATDANNLKLYLAEVDGSIDKQGRIDELKRLSRNLSECTELDEEHQLSGIFGEIPEGKKYYTLVRRPKSVSGIYVCIYGLFASVDPLVSINARLQNL
jgi:hypothetical protein